MLVRPFSIDDILGYRGCRLKRGREDANQVQRKRLSICSSSLNVHLQNNILGANYGHSIDCDASVAEVEHRSGRIVRTQRHVDAERVERYVGQFNCQVNNSTTLQTQQVLQSIEAAVTDCDVDRRSCCSDVQLRPGGETAKKRVRTTFTSTQLDRLEHEFKRQQYLVGTERSYLASVLRLSEAQVKVWFQNRRIKWRKQNLLMPHSLMNNVPSPSSSASSSSSFVSIGGSRTSSCHIH